MRYKIDIPKPCHEDWEQMTPTEKGKFCAVCQMEVLDLSACSYEEVVKTVINSNSLCAKINSDHLERSFTTVVNKKFSFYSIIAAFGLASLFPNVAKPQELIFDSTYPKEEQKEECHTTSGTAENFKVIIEDVPLKKISATLVNKKGKPIKGAKITVINSPLVAYTNKEGVFRLRYRNNDLQDIVIVKTKGLGSYEQRIATQSLVDQPSSVIVLKKNADPEVKSEVEFQHAKPKKSLWQRLLSFLGLN